MLFTGCYICFGTIANHFQIVSGMVFVNLSWYMVLEMSIFLVGSEVIKYLLVANVVCIPFIFSDVFNVSLYERFVAVFTYYITKFAINSVADAMQLNETISS